MNLVKNRRVERVEAGSGFIYNAFPTVELGNGLEVVVPSLAFGQQDARKPKTLLYEHRIEPEGEASKRVRILAGCVNEDCGADGMFIVDRDDKPASEFFRPRKGLDLNNGNFLPSVMAHQFGLIGLMFVDELYVEAQNRLGVGIITRP